MNASQTAQGIEVEVYAAAIKAYRTAPFGHRGQAAHVAAFLALPSQDSYANRSRMATRIAGVAIRLEQGNIVG